MEKQTGNILKKIIPLLCIVPFGLGTAGYILAGERVTDALYYSFSLYFVNLNSDAYNVAIEIARWLAALVTTVGVLYVLRQIWMKLERRFQCCRRDSVAVYSDEDLRITFQKKAHPVIYCGRNLCPAAKSQIIMLNTDADSLSFYEEHKEHMKHGNIYIGLKEIEYGLMKDAPNVTFYDIDGAIARILWKSIGLWEQGRKELAITILGNGHLGQNILNYGLLLNLFSLDQKLSYHFIGSDSLYQAAHGGIKTCNKDSVTYHSSDDNIWDIMKQSDLVIVSEKVSVEMLQAIGICCKNSSVYYYAPQNGVPAEYLNLPNIKPFGRDTEIYTDENIRGGKLIEQAKKLNYDYAMKYGGMVHTDAEQEWNKLDGFLKWSNISSADFNEVLRALIHLKPNMDKEELAELEHIRWCRFHFLNYWEYGVPENGAAKDKDKKIHKCLCAYSEMSEEDKAKDRAVVEFSSI